MKVTKKAWGIRGDIRMDTGRVSPPDTTMRSIIGRAGLARCTVHRWAARIVRPGCMQTRVGAHRGDAHNPTVRPLTHRDIRYLTPRAMRSNPGLHTPRPNDRIMRV